MTSTDDPIFRGCIPALMTPCNAERTPDFDNLVETGKKLMDSGMRAMVYCGSMGDWPLLTDERARRAYAASWKPACPPWSERVPKIRHRRYPMPLMPRKSELMV